MRSSTFRRIVGLLVLICAYFGSVGLDRMFLAIFSRVCLDGPD